MALVPSTERATDCYSLVPLTRHFPYHGDKLSRLAPPFELTPASLTLWNQEFSGRRADGAHVAEAIGVGMKTPEDKANQRRPVFR